jgi:acyl carrier protein
VESLSLSESDIRDWCIRQLASTLNVPASRIDPQAKFARLGMDSAMSIFFLVEIEEWLGIELPSDTVFEYPSVAELAHHLASRGSRQTTPPSRVD